MNAEKLPKYTITISVLLLVSAHLLALILVVPLQRAGVSAFEDPGNPMNSVIYIILLLTITGIILLAIKYMGDKVLRYILLAAIGYTLFYVIYLFLVIGDVPFSFFASLLLAATLIYAITKKPSWYLVDTVSVIICGGVIAILGASFSIGPALILLIALAIYDFVAVYKTKHMISLAESAIRMNVPLLLVVPKTARCSSHFVSLENARREAFFVGLGDIIVPGILVASSYVFLPYEMLGTLPAYLAVAVATMAGAALGLVFVSLLAYRGRPQAGLPLINGFAMAGFCLSYLFIYGITI